MDSRVNKRMWAFLLVCMGLWGMAFVGIRAALTSYSPEHLAAFRFLVVSITLGIYALFSPFKLPENQDISKFLLLGFIGITVYHLSLNWGERTVTAGSAGLLINTVPIFVALISHFILNKRLSRREWVGIVIGFIGITAIGSGESGGLGFGPGAALVVLSAVCSSLYMIFQQGLLQKYGPYTFACCANWSGTLFLLPFARGLARALRGAPWTATAWVVFLGVFPGAVAAILWAHILRNIPPTRAAAAIYLVPVITIAVAAGLLKEMPNALSLLGGALAILGVALVNVRRLENALP